jgi:hypothetical protein
VETANEIYYLERNNAKAMINYKMACQTEEGGIEKVWKSALTRCFSTIEVTQGYNQ